MNWKSWDWLEEVQCMKLSNEYAWSGFVKQPVKSQFPNCSDMQGH